jgi:hypothetical protein
MEDGEAPSLEPMAVGMECSPSGPGGDAAGHSGRLATGNHAEGGIKDVSRVNQNGQEMIDVKRKST